MPSTTKRICQHIRRHQFNPEGGCWILRCDCGWDARVPISPQREAADAELERQFIAHLRPEELRAYILCDTRAPEDPSSAEIVGNFVMPEGKPIHLVHSRYEDGMHFGTYRMIDEEDLHELPIGEVRTPDARVFRAE